MVEVIKYSHYVDMLDFLKSLHDEVVTDPAKERIIITSHPKVITMGRRTEPFEVLTDRWARLFDGVALFFTPRGGGATFHYPGQEVIYPVLSLENRGLSVHEYIEIMAESARGVLARMGVQAKWNAERPGLYVEGRKIASIGLRISRGVTSHGMSINILPDPGGFRMIYPCKASDLEVVSVQEITGTPPKRWDVARAVARALLSRIDDLG